MNADHLRNLDTYADDCDDLDLDDLDLDGLDLDLDDYIVVNTIVGPFFVEVPRCPRCGSTYAAGPDHRADCPHYEDEMPF